MKRLILLYLTILILSCDKKDTPTPAPTVTNISSKSLSPGATFTLTGSNFSTTPINNLIRFGLITVAVTSASDKTLTLTLPEDFPLGAYTVTVTVNGFTATLPDTVHVTLSIKKEDVYVAGHVVLDGTFHPAYWKNGKQFILDNQFGVGHAETIQVVVNGIDTVVYITGSFSNAYGNHVVLWKNGIASVITGNTKDTYIWSVAIDGADVYSIGVENDYSSHVIESKIWKNNNELAILLSNYASGSIYCKNGNVYALYNDNTDLKLWKNGNITTISITSACYGQSGEIKVNGNDEFVCGQFWSPSVHLNASYWQNGNFVNVAPAEDGTESMAISMDVNANDIYVAGYQYGPPTFMNIATYWKNGAASILSDGTSSESAYFISVANNHVYVTSSCNNRSILWKDGEKVFPFDGTQDIYAIAMCVVNN